MPRARIGAGCAAAAVLALFLAACGSDGGDTAGTPTPTVMTPTATGAVCASYAALEQSVSALKGIDISQVSAEQLTAVAEQVKTAASGFAAVAGAAWQAAASELSQAADQLSTTLGDVTDRQSLSAAATTIRSDIQTIDTKGEALRAQVASTCPDAVATTTSSVTASETSTSTGTATLTPTTASATASTPTPS